MRYDAVVIGGGICGASICYWLKKKAPRMRVALLEKQHLAFGATGRNGGFITGGSIVFFAKLLEKYGEEQGLKIWQFFEKNHALLREHILAEHAEAVYYHRNGSLSTYSKAGLAEKHKKIAQHMASLGLAVEWMEPDQLESYRLKGLAGGALYKGDGSVSSALLTRRIFDKSGADLYTLSSVTDIVSNGPSVTVRGENFSFESSMVYTAVNPSTENILPKAKGRIRPLRVQAFETEPIEQFLPFNVYITDEVAYFRQTHKGSILMGGQRYLGGANEETAEDKLNDTIQSSLKNLLDSHVVGSWKVDRQWSGIMGFTDEELPQIGTMGSNVLYLGGYSGHGMGMGFHCAKALVEWRLEDKPLPDFLKTFTD